MLVIGLAACTDCGQLGVGGFFTPGDMSGFIVEQVFAVARWVELHSFLGPALVAGAQIVGSRG
jgi:hypothetical protein